MSLRQSWEIPLLSLASEASVDTSAAAWGLQGNDFSYTEPLLEEAYQYCENLTAMHSRSFYVASGLYPTEKRRAARALYAFCRVTDDIVDEVETAGLDKLPEIKTNLENWRTRALSFHPPKDDLVAVAWADTRRHFRVPRRYGEQLLEGVARDLYQNRYETFEELAGYAYGVASTVGLMSMHITGFRGEDAIPYAIKLGVALQLTNILRDVAEDWQRGRVYLPQEELTAFGLNESDIASGMVSNRWRAFMRFQIARNRRLYQEAWPGIGMLAADGRFAIAAAAELYQGILNDIEKHDYDVFSRRSFVGKWGKMRRLPQIWWRSRGRYLNRLAH